MRTWNLASIGMGIIGVIVFTIALYQAIVLNNDELSFAMPLGFGLLLCSIINFIVLYSNKKKTNPVTQTENDERIMAHGKAALSVGFMVMTLVSITIMVLYQFRLELNGFDSAIVMLLSGILSSLVYFVYKLSRY